MMIVYPEDVATMKEEIDFYQEHHNEVFSDRTLNIDWDTFAHLERADSLRIYMVRTHVKSDPRSMIAGYSVWVTHNDTHDKDHHVAICDCIYLKKEYRGHGGEILSICERDLKMNGVNEVRMPAPEGSRLDNLLLRKGYRKLETIYYKDVSNGRISWKDCQEDSQKTS